jgi:hypothetical protein
MDERLVSSGKGTGAVLVDEGDALGVSGGQPLQDFGRTVGRAIVHHDEFRLRITLPEHAGDRLFHIGRGVVAGHDDGDQRGVEVVHGIVLVGFVARWQIDGQAVCCLLYGCLQGWQVLLDDIPDQIEIDTKILVSKHVSGACDLCPWDSRLLGAQTLGPQVLHGLSDHFQVAYNGILGFVVIEKSCAAFCYVGFYAEDAIMDVPDVNGRVFFHSVTASSSMRLRR